MNTVGILLIALTIPAVLGLLIFIGKFFCVKLFEVIYDTFKKENYADETGSFLIFFYCIGVGFLIPAWIFYFFKFEFGYMLSTIFSTFLSAIYFGIFIYTLIARTIVPSMKAVHKNIKLKKELIE